MSDTEFTSEDLLKALKMVGESLDWPSHVEILIIGGAAGIVTGVLGPYRTTGDCDVADYHPPAAASAVEQAAHVVAGRMNLPATWFNDRIRQMNVLPDGWKSRRQYIATFGMLKVFAAGRLDLLAMKVFAHRTPDREDIAAMGIAEAEIEFIRKYLLMLKVPSRKADLDHVAAAEAYLCSLEDRLK